MISANDYLAVTGETAPENFEAVEARVVARLSALLNRDLVVDYPDGLPADLEDAVAWGVHTVANPTAMPSTLPQGATSLSIAGEYSVAMAAGSVQGRDGYLVPARFAFAGDLGGRCLSTALRYRRIPLGY